MRIGIDFDRVLFDTEGFKQSLFTDIDGFNETYADAENGKGVYDPDKHAEILEIDVSRIHEALSKASKFLYGDIGKLDLIESHEVVIVSRGDPNFQAEKIQRSGALGYADDYCVVHDRSKDAADIDFLADDSRSELEQVELREDQKFLFSREQHGVEDILKRVQNLGRAS